ncbi:SGNH/GDSL hydrolase family protein [Crossiella sp. CA-258035]|uniref:SGNH/GDSL hydrolase family protein n=1 Tax=Crossiella sp. CA-258035 TaxID=2981138 RepID=UPI0024BD3ED0|nr:SGNH/GDSL hydrolase family protein [Crossiella sp. CA-258035]WHT22907.1 SGNH/GDSL hydrolase family protein [Crossiella sp. CA-258035]
MRGRFAAGLAMTAAAMLMGPAAQADSLEYVAMGDSAAAGPLIPHQNINLLCLRSDRNYPAVAARELGASLRDVSCSGAVTADFAGKRFGFIPAQFDALRPSTDLVSVTIGANDSGLFQQALSCLNLLPEPAGLSCADRLTAGGKDQLAAAVDAWAPKFGAALDEIRKRAPKAKILVTGYGTYIRPEGCHPVQPVWAKDGRYLQSVMNRISAAARTQAQQRGATYVDFAAITVGHDICAAPAQRYLEGLIPTSPAAPLHPNARGMAAFGKAVAAAAR